MVLYSILNKFIKLFFMLMPSFIITILLTINHMYNATSLSINTDQTSSMQKVQLFLSGRNLLDMDFLSKSDPYVRVFFQTNPSCKMNMIGRTQTVMDNLNPNFITTFTLEYIFQAKQEIKFEVYDSDDDKNQSNDDYIGSVSTTLGSLTGAKNQTSILTLQGKDPKQKCGKLIVRVQPCSQSNQFFVFKWKGRKLMNTDSFFDFWDKSDPYLKFLKIRNDNTFVQVARTQIIMNNLNPDWKPIEISANKLLTAENSSGKFKVECWDWQEKGQTYHQFIGQSYVQINQIKDKKYPFQFSLVNRKHKNPGYIDLQMFRCFHKPSFLQYLRGGLELNLSICIDFTGSNGVPNHPTSLHYFSQNKPNQYQMAIEAVSRILLEYDYDKRIPAFGFGAKTRYNNLFQNKVSHCFPLSGDPNKIEAFGLEHLIQLYNQARSSVEFGGPTLFGPLLQESFKLAYRNFQQGSNTYQVLLILTDGQIHDMDQTVDLLVQNCGLPISIIIVGIGNAEFSNMVRLDGDNGLFDSKGKKAARDIVQFVPFREVGLNSDSLARQLLAELPGQVTQYMSLIGKPPGKPLQANIQSIISQPAQNTNMSMQQIFKEQLAQKFKQAF